MLPSRRRDLPRGRRAGPTFWFGGTVTDPSSLFGQAIPGAAVLSRRASSATARPDGGFVRLHTRPNDVHRLLTGVEDHAPPDRSPNFHEPAAFNAMLDQRHPSTSRWSCTRATRSRCTHFVTAAPRRRVGTSTSPIVTTRQSGTIVLTQQRDGPLLPGVQHPADRQLARSGARVHDTPNSFVWEIGHTSPFTSPA